MANFTRQTIATCDPCQINKIPTEALQAIREPVLSRKPLALIFIDLIGPITKTKYRYKRLLVIMNTFMKITKFYLLRKATSEIAIKKLHEFSGAIGRPQKVLSDGGTELTSHKWRQAPNDPEIKMISRSIRHPQANIMEAVSREQARLFRTLLLQDKHGSWFAGLENVKCILNDSYHDTLKITPYEVLWKRKPKRWWMDLLPLAPPHSRTDRQELIMVLR